MSINSVKTSDTTWREGLFFEEQRQDILTQLKPYFYHDLTRIIADYVIGAGSFGKKEWKKYYGVEVIGRVPSLLPVADYWFSQDRYDPTKRVYETHFSPTLRPAIIRPAMAVQSSVVSKKLSSFVSKKPFYNIENLRALALYPRKGEAADIVQFEYVVTRVSEEADGPIPEEADETGLYWLVMRKPIKSDLFFSQQEQLKEYRIPTAIDLCTVILTYHVVTKQRYLGDETGMEGREVYGLCREKINGKSLSIGNFKQGYPGYPDTLKLSRTTNIKSIDVTPMREFS